MEGSGPSHLASELCSEWAQGRIEARSYSGPCFITVQTTGGDLPPWAPNLPLEGEVYLEVLGISEKTQTLPLASQNPSDCVTFYDEALANARLPPSVMHIAVAKNELEGAMEGFVSTFYAPQLIGVELFCIKEIAGVARSDLGAEALHPRSSEGRAFVLPGLAQGSGALATEVRYRLDSLARDGFDGGVFLHTRITDPSFEDWSLELFSDFYEKALPDGSSACITATTEAIHDNVCVYAFKRRNPL